MIYCKDNVAIMFTQQGPILRFVNANLLNCFGIQSQNPVTCSSFESDFNPKHSNLLIFHSSLIISDSANYLVDICIAMATLTSNNRDKHGSFSIHSPFLEGVNGVVAFTVNG